MNILDEYTKRVIQTLNDCSVKYLVVGGYAVNFYGYTRTTGDIDLWIAPENGENKASLISAFSSLEIDESSLFQLNLLDFTKAHVFDDGEEPFKIEFLTKISGVDFQEAYQKKVWMAYDEIMLPFIHFDHLILSKINTDRTKDKADVEELQKIKSQAK